MATFKKFEEIQAWQKARRVTRKIYEVTTQDRFARDFALRDQIRRASISIMANIAEGFGRHSDKDFANFLSIAHASVSEVQSHLCVALDLDYLPENLFYRAVWRAGRSVKDDSCSRSTPSHGNVT